jgi:hypothetical protein
MKRIIQTPSLIFDIRNEVKNEARHFRERASISRNQIILVKLDNSNDLFMEPLCNFIITG